jgi:hypothetical protein
MQVKWWEVSVQIFEIGPAVESARLAISKGAESSRSPRMIRRLNKAQNRRVEALIIVQ